MISIRKTIGLPALFATVTLAAQTTVHSTDYHFDVGCREECYTPPQEWTLFVPDAKNMCPESEIYGSELSRPFVSRLWKTGESGEEKTWQLRTVTVFDTQNKPHHLLFPFSLSTGGITHVGVRAAAVLQEFGAQKRPNWDEDSSFCRLKINLPIKDLYCVGQAELGRYFDDMDIRNNMIGASYAAAIIKLNSFANAIELGAVSKEAVLKTLMEQFSDAQYGNFEQELDLLLQAPISKEFLPPEIKIPSLALHVSMQNRNILLSNQMDEFAIKHSLHFSALQSESDPDYNLTMAFMQAYMSYIKDIKEEAILYMRNLIKFYSKEENYKLLTREAKHIVNFVRKHKIIDEDL